MSDTTAAMTELIHWLADGKAGHVQRRYHADPSFRMALRMLEAREIGMLESKRNHPAFAVINGNGAA